MASSLTVRSLRLASWPPPAATAAMLASSRRRALSTPPGAGAGETAKAKEAVKETLKKVDRAVSEKLVGGIELGEAVAQKAKEVAKDVKGKAAELEREGKGKGKAKGKL